jgi:hypothetical protein
MSELEEVGKGEKVESSLEKRRPLDDRLGKHMLSTEIMKLNHNIVSFY